MFRSIWEDTKREFSYGNMVTRLIIINVAVFVFINLVWVALRLAYAYETPGVYYTIRNFFSISSDWLHNFTHPWVFITSMFLHDGFWHIFWNMILLYMVGRILGDLLGDHRLLAVYLLGGLAGGVAFFLSVNLLPYGGDAVHYALGASGAVMAVALAAGFTAPDYYVRLLLLGDVKLKWIVGALVLMDLIGIAGDINTGGHFAHFGGAIFGMLFALQMQRGNDWSVPVNRLLDNISRFFRRIGTQRPARRGPKVSYRNPNRTTTTTTAAGANSRRKDPISLSHQEQLDAILDKIKDKGYNSLTQDEKDFLFNASKKG